MEDYANIDSRSFVFAIKKLSSNTKLFGNPDINTLLCEYPSIHHLNKHILTIPDDAIDIGIWNSIENDFVLSAACLPHVPPFFRAFSKVVKTHVSTSRSTYIKSHSGSMLSARKDDSGGTELMNTHTVHIVHPEGSKVGSERRPSEFI